MTKYSCIADTFFNLHVLKTNLHLSCKRKFCSAVNIFSPLQKIPPKLLLFNTTFITILVILLAIMCIHEGN